MKKKVKVFSTLTFTATNRMRQLFSKKLFLNTSFGFSTGKVPSGSDFNSNIGVNIPLYFSKYELNEHDGDTIDGSNG